MQFLQELENLAIEVSLISFRKDSSRNADIIKKRFCLKGEQFYSLEDIGSYYGITRERVRQIEEKTLNNLRLILDGKTLNEQVSVNNSFLETFAILKQKILNLDYILFIEDIITTIYTGLLCLFFNIS